MSRHARDAAIAMDRSEQNGRSWRNLADRRVVLTSLLAGVLLLGIASVAVHVAEPCVPAGQRIPVPTGKGARKYVRWH
jgi:hypothetical protein